MDRSVHARPTGSGLEAPLAPPRTALAAAFLALVMLVAPTAGRSASPAGDAGARDPGLVLELDRARFELASFDARSGESGPRVRIVLGSPANETPAGDHPIGRVILNPSWYPSESALAAGAEPTPPSLDSPMGVAKLPFAGTGSIALHGGGEFLLLGKPVSGGCVRARDADLLRILAWMLERDALGPPRRQRDGEVHRSFRRPVRLRIHDGAPPS